MVIKNFMSLVEYSVLVDANKQMNYIIVEQLHNYNKNDN